MLGAHQLAKLSAALAIGIGIVLSPGGAADAAEGAILGTYPFHITMSESAYGAPLQRITVFKRKKAPSIASLSVASRRDGARTTAGLFDFANKEHHSRPDGLLGLNDGSALVHAFADIPAAPHLVLSFGQGDAVSFEVAQLPIPGTVWLFLAALALLFGISRRQIANR